MKTKKRFLSILLSLALMLGLMPGMSMTAYATTYSDYISDDLQVGDILKPGARYFEDNITVILQANGWGSEGEASTSEKRFTVEMRGLEIRDEGCIEVEGEDYSSTYCYPYANGEKVSAWEVVSFDGGEEPWEPKTITLTGFAPPAREPVTEISSDTTLSANINGYITITDNVTLDLAGYTITGGGYHSTIIINNGYTLTLIDSSTGKTGKITGGGGDAGGGVAVSNNATFNMQGGTISGNTATNGGGVALGGGATFTMSGGTITGNSADNGGGVYSSGSSFSMTGGTISNNSAGDFNYGGGVLIQSGNFSMSGTAAITGNVGGSDGGGVYFDGSTFTMSGGSISGGNHATSGGGVYVNSGTFNMTGGTITGNSTDGWAGGGVYTCSIFNMSGSAAITGNSASTEGGGVYQDRYSSAVFTMTGGSITNNTSGSKGYAGVCIREAGTFNLSGGAVIDGNTHGGTEEDICLYPGNVVKVTGALTMENTMSVRLTNSDGNDNGTGTIAQGSGYTLTETDGAKFIASTTNRRAKYDSENSKEILVALYTVTYNANGATSGTVPTDENNPYESGSTVTVLGNTGNLAKTSHNFNGWNTAANGSGTPYAADATFNIEKSTTLYAQWEEVTHAHDFIYYASGATITATCANADGNCTLPPSTEGGSDHVATLTIAAAGGTYDGTTAFIATVTNNIPAVEGDTVGSIEYYKVDAEGATTGGTKQNSAPVNAGYYYASVTLTSGSNSYSAVKAFTVAKGTAEALDENTARTNSGINYQTEQATPSSGYQISTDNANPVTSTPVSLTDILDGNTPTIYVRRTETDNQNAGDWVAVTLAVRPAAPTGLTTTNATNGGMADGKINGTSATMEYSANSGTNWSDASATETLVTPGTYLVRVKATDSAPHGVAATVTVGSNYVALDENTKPTVTVSDSHNPPQVGDTLTAETAATDLIYQWYRGNDPIDNATGATYNLTVDDLGKAITVTVRQTKQADGTDYAEADRPARTSDPTSAVVKKAGPAAPANAAAAGFVPNYPEETFTIGNDYEVSSANGDTVTAISSLADVIDGTGKVYIRAKETADTQASAWLEVTLPSRPDAPTAPATENATNGGTADGKIKNALATWEYRNKETGKEPTDWTTMTAGDVSVKPGTYQIRVKATDSAPHGTATEVTVGSNYVALDGNTKPTVTVSDSHNPPVVDDILTASTTASDIVYEWYRDGEKIDGQTASTFTLTANDVGKAITVKVMQTKDENGTDYAEGARPSQTSEATAAVVKKAGPDAPADATAAGFKIDYAAETFTVDDDYEVSTTKDDTGTGVIPDGSLTGALDGEGKIYIRKKETADTQAGAWLEVTLSSRPAALSGLTTESATDGGTADGKIKGTTADMEYSPDNGTTWIDAAATETAVKPGTYLVRVKATNDTPAGRPAEVTVGSKEIILPDDQKPKVESSLGYTGSEHPLVVKGEAKAAR